MPDVRMVQGDTRPELRATLTLTRSGEPRDLTGAASVKFQMRKADDRHYTVNAEAEILDAEAGDVRYVWSANDLRTPGLYDAQWEITWAEGAIQTTTPVNSIEVRPQ